MIGVLLPLGLVAGLAALAGVIAVKQPVLFRMAARNALRRRAQTAVVIAGLMVGTAIIAGSLATGDSLAQGIRQGAYDGLGPVDAFVSVEGQLAFPMSVYDALAGNATVRESTHALSPLLLEDGALTNPRTRLSEPQVPVIGFDADLDRPMGAFHLTDGTVTHGENLAWDEVILAESLARSVDARPGDEVTLNYAITPPPIVPVLHSFTGTVTAGAGACLPEDALDLPAGGVPIVDDVLDDACEHVTVPQEDPPTFPVDVNRSAVSATVVLTWYGQGAELADLDPVLVDPDGERYVNPNGTPAMPDNPAVLNVTADDGRTLPRGEWTLEVNAKAAVDQPFNVAVLVFYEVYDLAQLRQMTQDLRDAGFDPEEMGFGEPGGGASRPLQATFTVAGVATDEGKGNFLLGDNVFMRLDRAQSLYEREDRVNVITVSHSGDAESGLARTPAVRAVMEEALADVRAGTDDPASQQVAYRAVKQSWVDAADRAGSLFKQFLTTISSFTIIAGVMLIVNIFVMLAEERKSELGMARAVGLKRRQLVMLFTFEGILYALVASALGVLLGLAIAWGLIAGFNNLLAQNADTFVTFPFRPEAASLAWAFTVGFLLTVATVLAASARVARLNVVRAIRRLDDPPRRAGGWHVLAGGALLAAGAAGTWQGVVADSLPLIVLAPCLGLIGLGLILARWFPARLVHPLAGGSVAAYCTWTVFTLQNPEGLVNQLMGPARGVLIVIGVVLVVVNVPQLVPWTKRFLLRFRGLVPAVAPGVAYPLAKKTRTGLTISMFALVILVVVAFSIFGATFQVDLAAQAGGYDVEAESTIPISDLEAHYRDHGAADTEDPFPLIAHYDALKFGQSFGGDFITINGERVNYQGPPADYVYAYPESFIANNDYAFESLHPDYPTAEAAYRAVFEDASLVIISTAYNFDEAGQPGAHDVGDTLTMHTRGGDVDFTIIGIQKQIYLGGVWVHEDVVRTNFQTVRGQYLFNLEEGVDALEGARVIEAAFTDVGMNAKSIEAEAAALLEQNRQFFTLFRLFLTFGLVVGIASLGIVTARSVIERRQEIGMLRAIGYPREQVLRIFLIEILLTTTLGVVIGSVIGFLVSYGVVTATESLQRLGVAFTVPWASIGLILLVTYAAVLACTFYPARQASRIPAAEAVRYVE